MPEGAGPASRLRAAIVDALYPVSAYDLEDVCTSLGLAPPEEGERAFDSKARYVKRRLHGLSVSELLALGTRVYEEHSAVPELQAALGRSSVTGVDGSIQNLIFAADGPKPRIVLRDALNNVIEIVENEQYCLVYDNQVSEAGLTWGELVQWWAARAGHDPQLPETRRALYQRLRASLSPDSPAEVVLFDAYQHFYRPEYRGSNPVLIPQVYLHYDPYTRVELAARRGAGEVLERQRMDFLLLFSDRTRIVIEVDGKHHYAAGDRADPRRYAAMVAEDRALRLAGYEVYRFGAAELLAPNGPATARAFFGGLLDRYDSGAGA